MKTYNHLGEIRGETFKEALDRESDVSEKCSLLEKSLDGPIDPSEVSEVRDYLLQEFGKKSSKEEETIERFLSEARLGITTGLISYQLGRVKGLNRRQIAEQGYKILGENGINMDSDYRHNSVRSGAVSVMKSCVLATANFDLIKEKLIDPYERRQAVK